MTVANKPRGYKSRPDITLDVPGLRVFQPVIDCPAVAVDYTNHRLLKKLSGYEDKVAHERHKMAKKIAVKVKNHAFVGKDSISVIAFLEQFRSTFDACKIYESAAM